MNVRAKFRVHELTAYETGHRILLRPVTSGSEENAQFYKWTPGGEIVLQTINPEAAKEFSPGAEFYVDFTAAK